jgi:Family of unknown function (DUF6266)
MAKYGQGILGPVSGSVGSVVGSSWRGISYLRSKGVRSKREPSPKQDIQRLKFKLAVQFVRPLAPLLEVTFASSQATGVNNAMAYTLKRSLTGTYPDIVIDYAQVLIARGSLPNAESIAASLNGNMIDVAWTSNAGTGKAASNDKSMMAVYSPVKQNWVYVLNGPERSAGIAGIDVKDLTGDLHIYLAFVSADEKDVSDSFYAGYITV